MLLFIEGFFYVPGTENISHLIPKEMSSYNKKCICVDTCLAGIQNQVWVVGQGRLLRGGDTLAEN